MSKSDFGVRRTDIVFIGKAKAFEPAGC